VHRWRRHTGGRAPIAANDRDAEANATEKLDASEVARAKSLPSYVWGRLLDLVGGRVAVALRDVAIAATGRVQDFPSVLERLDVPKMAARVLGPGLRKR
jgi:hypothetical protein